ncbi:MAG: T9SS type A sorting domain-containing protein [Bacteroidales bacterium]|nr:MAG: T9SS type A sorting domain-containing protein [Bacteroidales bacterium]
MIKNILQVICQICRELPILVFLTFFVFISSFGQGLIINPDMEIISGWTIYHMGSSDTANYEFNYTTDGPEGGVGGCLRVTSEKRTNILFWQKLDLKGGKSYILDGLVKTSYVASFWCELYLSIIAPVENEDYTPNNNEDVVLGLSTWAGCGPNLNGKFSEVACVGNGIYIPTGDYDQDVEVYFGIKTGIWNDMVEIEVLLDEFRLELVENWLLLSTSEGELDQGGLRITNVSPLITVEDFKTGLRAPLTASVDIIGSVSGEVVPDQSTTLISDTMLVRVTGNEITYYNIETREVGTGNDIISALTGIVDLDSSRVTDLPGNALVIQLKSAITVSPYATYKVTHSDHQVPSNHALISEDLIITVKAENGDEKTFTIVIDGIPMGLETITDSAGTFSSVKNRLLNLEGNIDWHITRDNNPLEGSIINLDSDNIWIFFDSIRPLEFSGKYLDHILISDTAASVDENVRLVQYLNGSVIISHSADYKPLQVFTEDSLKGNSMEPGLYTYNESAELGEFNNAIKSFKLKKGYMATFARDDRGTGYSKVFVADTGDIIISKLQDGLYSEVSFIRVFPWRWTFKKGWTSNINSADTLNCSWHYDWGAGGVSSLNVEFIPMRHNKYWDDFSKINAKRNTTHVLGYNEPERPDQADMTVTEAIEQWPQLLRSGLRLGSPAPSDGGLSWLYSFIDRCDNLNYRVDFVAVHWYQGGQTAKQFYNWLKAVHDRTGRPLWITEWNNGANWTCCKPTYTEQAIAIEQFIHMLDTTFFVERYSLYEWVEDTRQMFYSSDPVVLNPAGIVYRDNPSAMAFNRDKEFSIDFIPIPYPATNPQPGHGSINIDTDTVLSWSAGAMSQSHYVYFGTTNPPPYAGNLTDTFYIPSNLVHNTTYYWRIDEVNDAGFRTGDVWRFTTLGLSGENTLETENINISIYPNPVYEMLYLKGFQGDVFAEISNTMGVKVFSEIVSDRINIRHLPEGMYILKVGNNSPIRFIKE